MRAPCCLSLSVFLAAVAPPTLAQDDLGAPPRKILPMDDAETVRIGMPYDTTLSALGGIQACLAGYDATIDEEDPNRFEQRMVQSTNAMEIARALNIDASAKGIVGGVQVSGKLGFAANTSVAHNALNYTLFAHYQAPPRRMAQQDGAVIRLTPFAQDLIDRDINDFRDSCGDSFVDVIFRGAEAFGTLSFHTVDASERRKIDAAVDAKGVGWSASAALKDEIKTQSTSGKLSVTFSQTGGLTGPKTGSAEDQWAKLEQAVEGIKGTSSPVKTGYQVVSYAALPGWSHGPLTTSPDILDLVYRLTAFDTLNRTLVPMINDPWQTELDFVMRRDQGGGAGSIAALTTLQTDLLAARDTVAAILAACRDWTLNTPPAACASQEVLNRYAGRVTQSLHVHGADAAAGGVARGLSPGPGAAGPANLSAEPDVRAQRLLRGSDDAEPDPSRLHRSGEAARPVHASDHGDGDPQTAARRRQMVSDRLECPDGPHLCHRLSERGCRDDPIHEKVQRRKRHLPVAVRRQAEGAQWRVHRGPAQQGGTNCHPSLP